MFGCGCAYVKQIDESNIFFVVVSLTYIKTGSKCRSKKYIYALPKYFNQFSYEIHLQSGRTQTIFEDKLLNLLITYGDKRQIFYFKQQARFVLHLQANCCLLNTLILYH